MNRIMAIGAHPDDIEFGCGGTLLKHKQNGDFVVYVCMTSTVSTDGVTGKVLRTKDAREGLKAFKEKRSPKWEQ